MNGRVSKQLRKYAIEDVKTFIADNGREALKGHKESAVIKAEYRKKKRNYKKLNWKQKTAFLGS